ncbi:hypothetical protein [Brevundimonas naejangsanensis]|uniref:hypothetical protein n=1 Tax=Brevundimonas naejangsanensis TaxID=588932 RepID=UPI00106B06BE|nr:hypothetical protein [Brevundimonas naejangsanensis]QBQ49518.1 hypothetical protein E3U41_12955 [Brevundimonas naejangsanensis]
MTTPSYPFGRYYAASQKHLTDALDRHVGKGRWQKTDVFIDRYLQKDGLKDRLSAKPFFGIRSDGYEYTTVYQGVMFKDRESASLARLMIPMFDDENIDGEMVLCRSLKDDVAFSLGDRYWAIKERRLAWESKSEAAASVTAMRAYLDEEYRME